MPKRRFEKLDPEVRGRILKAAALEFGTHGYADASLNRIVEQAGISKGSMYYYFEDKEDLFGMVLLDLKQRSAHLLDTPLHTLTAVTYWHTVGAVFRAWLQIAIDNPWVHGFLQLFSEMLRNPPTEGPLVAWYAEMEQRRADFIRHGQLLRTVRSDLPLPFLTDLMHGVQMVQGRYFMKHFAQMSAAERERMADAMIDVMRRVLEPRPAEAGTATAEPAAPPAAGKSPTAGTAKAKAGRAPATARKATAARSASDNTGKSGSGGRGKTSSVRGNTRRT